MNNKGFTLMEILLAAMIVGVIGVALAALTTAAVRESGVGRTKTMLRHQLSNALRQLHQDIQQSDGVTLEYTSDNVFQTMELTQSTQFGPNYTPHTFRYTFTPGTIAGAGGGTTGGKIYRSVDGGASRVWLENVKSIRGDDFLSPSVISVLWNGEGNATGGANSVLEVRIIVEVPSTPVVNDVIDEIFVLPHGFAISN